MATNDLHSEELRKKAYEAVDAYLDAGGQLPLIVVNQDWLEKQPIIEKLLSETRIDELSLYDKDPRDWYYYYSDRIQSLNKEGQA